MGDPRNDESSPKAKQVQARARREQQERLASALEELQKWQERKSGEKAKREVRVSTGDPHARAIHQADGGLALNYNAQISKSIGMQTCSWPCRHTHGPALAPMAGYVPLTR
jgi:hypothetical protein